MVLLLYTTMLNNIGHWFMIDTIVISPLLYKENILIFQIVLNVFQLRFATPIEMKQQPLFLVMLIQKETEVIKTKLNVRCPNFDYIVLLEATISKA